MKKAGLIYTMSILVLITVMTGCSKKNTSPSGPGSAAKMDTVIKGYKQDKTNYLLATINGTAIGTGVNSIDTLITTEIDSNGIVNLLALVAPFSASTPNINSTATSTLIIYFLKPASLSVGATIDVYHQTTAGLDYAPDSSGIQSYADYQAGYDITGSSGSFTITANDLTGKRITGTFDQIVATDQNTNFQAKITGGSFSVSY